MNFYFIKIKIITAIFLFALLPSVLFAQTGKQICSSDGYTITTINGVFTDENGAIANRDALKYYFEDTYNGEPLTVDYLLNPSHLGGLGDLAISVYQKAFESETVLDYDLVEMLKDASAKVKTQKLLLFAHSQGNFYANSFYDTVAGQLGGVPKESIGVYSVASPASRVAGGGQWITSDTDKVIAGVVASVPFKKIMPPNTHIALGAGDDIVGHGLTQAYLKYRSAEIVAGIQASLDKLSSNTVRNESDLCINPPKFSVVHKIEGKVLAVADPVATVGVTTVATTAKVGVFVAVTTVKAGVIAAVFTYNTTEAFAKWGSHMEAVAIVWTYHTTVTVAKTAWGIASTIGSFAYNVLTGALSNNQVANNNTASVILATTPSQGLPVINVNEDNAITTATTAPIESQLGVTEAQQQPQTVFVFEPKVQSGTNAPKLVFVGSFPGGLAGAQVMGTQSTTPVIEEVAVVEEEIVDNVGVAIATPALSAPQCSQTLATDGCLLATTIVHFEWSDVAGADYYLLNKNGEYATTTEKSFEVEIKDFSDYIFEVVAVGADGTASATSTQAVSVATIPIAINEIAWMGTKASPSDEWFEIKNNTGHTIDLSQWELNAKDNTPYVKLTGTIAPRAYLIFERTDDTAVKDVDAHQIYKGELGNSGEQLNLSYASTTMDQTPDGAWPAGATSTRQTMERYSSRESGTDPENWGTNLGYIKNGTDAKDNPIEGTPGEQNSVSTLINKGQDITSDFTLTADEEQYVIAKVLRVSASSTLTVEPGVEIKFYENGSLFVEGALDVQGASENPVIFRSIDETPSGTIIFRDTTGTSTIDYARIESTRGLIARGASTTVEISNTEFSRNATAVELYGGAHVSLASSTIKDTFEYDAIGVYYSTMTIASSTIDNTLDGDAIGVYYSNVTIASSTISNTLEGDAIGVYYSTMAIDSTTIDGTPDRNGIFSYKSVLDIENSTIRNTEDDAIILSNGTSTITNTIIEGSTINEYGSGIYIYKGTATIASTTISDITGWAGVYVGEGILSISSSTIKNVADYGMYAYEATSTISNVTVENGGSNGVDIYQGTATIADSRVSGFTEGVGVSVFEPASPVTISGGEITGNEVGIEMDPADSVIVTDMSSVHDNGTTEADNVVVW